MREKCVRTGLIVTDSRRDGYGCAEHTDLIGKGGNKTGDQLFNYYPDMRDQYPYGRYCCAYCKVQRHPVS